MPSLRELRRRALRAVRPARMAVAVSARRLRRHDGSLPQLVIIGAQRAGTTSLYSYLSGHPDVRSPLQKEIQYLTLGWERGEDWYRRHFPVLGPGQWTFEASPYYLFHPAAPLRAATALAGTQFVALLREPVARAWSHYQFNRANGLEDLPFADALAAEDDRLAPERSIVAAGGEGRAHRLYSYLSRGRYADQVQRWQDAVGDRLLVLRSEDLFRDPATAVTTVLGRLGVAPWQPSSFEVGNRFRATTGERLDPGLAAELRARLAPDNARLADLLGWDLSGWT